LMEHHPGSEWQLPWRTWKRPRHSQGGRHCCCRGLRRGQAHQQRQAQTRH
jgi:hypothetical protein